MKRLSSSPVLSLSDKEILGEGNNTALEILRCDHAKRIQELIAKGSDPHAHPATGVTQADWEWIVDFIRSDTYQKGLTFQFYDVAQTHHLVTWVLKDLATTDCPLHPLICKREVFPGQTIQMDPKRWNEHIKK
ncbi:hypothetical protein QJS10_CPB15g00864 [Acorus calamus]|uniref:Uncharacterized protein n=1 Tax=Acorus calamus TaxID=4465 RepID=A0AAV9D769_ACOCL|nr:hypothetical protein QJS10_CPB15g00864 [Acorus calamus]